MGGFDTMKDNFGEPMDRFGPDTKNGTGGSSIFQQGQEFLMGKTPTAESLTAAKGTAYDSAYKTVLDKTKDEALAKAAGTKAMEGVTMKSLQPSFLRKYGPTLALTAAGSGFFDKPEMKELDDFKIGQDLVDENRGKYIVQNTDIVGAQPPSWSRHDLGLTQAHPCNMWQKVVKQVVQKSFHDAPVV